jgi:hypothetical protein
MLTKMLTAALVALSLPLVAMGCGKPPKQADSPDALSDKGADMSSGEDKGGDIKTKPGEKSGDDQMQDKCCAQCREGLKVDRSGANAETTPCTDFTATLDVFCLEHFRGRKTMAAQCK